MDRRKYGKSEYIEGSTARQLYAVPDYEEEEYGRVRPKQPGKPDREERVRRSRKRNARRQSLDLPSTLFLAAAVCVTMAACAGYLKIQAGITGYDRKIASLESEIMRLESENEAARDRLDEALDLAHVYNVATKQLGMVHPSENQVIPYRSTKSDFMRQYGTIPE